MQLPASLTRLTLEGDVALDETLSRWLRQVQLEKLVLDARIGRAIAPALATQRGLWHLQIINAPFVDEDFAFLANCSDLSVVYLECMPIKGEFLAGLSQLKELCELKLRATLLSDKAASAMGKLEHLESLQLDWTSLNGEGFSSAIKWPKLQKLSLIGCQFSEKGKRSVC